MTTCPQRFLLLRPTDDQDCPGVTDPVGASRPGRSLLRAKSFREPDQVFLGSASAHIGHRTYDHLHRLEVDPQLAYVPPSYISARVARHAHSSTLQTDASIRLGEFEPGPGFGPVRKGDHPPLRVQLVRLIARHSRRCHQPRSHQMTSPACGRQQQAKGNGRLELCQFLRGLVCLCFVSRPGRVAGSRRRTGAGHTRRDRGRDRHLFHRVVSAPAQYHGNRKYNDNRYFGYDHRSGTPFCPTRRLAFSNE